MRVTATASHPGLSRYGCLRACLVWVLFVSGVVTLLFHWGTFPPPPTGMEADAYLPGLYARISTDPVYQAVYLASPFGVLGYGLCLLVALRARIRFRASGISMTRSARLAHRLCGMPSSDPDEAEWRITVDHGIDYAVAPVRDATIIYPGLGFLGTIVGISISIGGLPTAMANQDLTVLTSGLRIAFDTTFFGLVASLMLSLVVLLAQARHAEAVALDDVRETGDQLGSSQEGPALLVREPSGGHGGP